MNITCPSCNQSFVGTPREGNLCPLCGAHLDDKDMAVTTQAGIPAGRRCAASPTKAGTRTTEIILGALGTALILGGIGGFFMAGHWARHAFDTTNLGLNEIAFLHGLFDVISAGVVFVGSVMVIVGLILRRRRMRKGSGT